MLSSAGNRTVTPAPDPFIGRVFDGRFRVLKLLARGGMGRVYQAVQLPLGRSVALKILDPTYTSKAEHDFRRRFFLEAAVCAKLRHPNTVTIFDYGQTADDVYYIAMEYLQGRTLRRALRQERFFHPVKAMYIAAQICRSLREAHAIAVVHRDLKPANVFLVSHDDEENFVKVLDFGLVKNMMQDGEGLTKAGLFLGSPGYMAPEQIRGQSIDARADVYSLGCIVFEMLAGRAPFKGDSTMDTLLAHLNQPVPAIRTLNPAACVPLALEEVVYTCLSKAPEQRFAGMQEVLQAIKDVAGATAELQWQPAENAWRSSLMALRQPSHAPGMADGSADALSPGEMDPSGSGWAVMPAREVLAARRTVGRSVEGGLRVDSRICHSVISRGGSNIARIRNAISRCGDDSTRRDNGISARGDDSKRGVEAARRGKKHRHNENRHRKLGTRWGRVMMAVAFATASVVLMGLLLIAWTGSRTAESSFRHPWQLMSWLARMQASSYAAVHGDETLLGQQVELNMRSRPAGAAVFVDDVLVCSATPCTLAWWGDATMVGRPVAFRFSKAGYADAQITQVLADERLEIFAALTRKGDD